MNAGKRKSKRLNRTKEINEQKYQPRSKHSYPCLCSSCPRFSCMHSSTCFGWNFPMSVAARKSITAWSHFSMENSSEICTCRHLPAFHPVAFPNTFQSAFCWSFHWQQWWKRCSHVCSVPLLHHQHLKSSWWPNRFWVIPISECPLVLATVPDRHFGSESGSELNSCQMGGPGYPYTWTVNSGTVQW